MGQASIDTVMLKRSNLRGNHASAVRSKMKKKHKPKRFAMDLPGWLVDALRASSYGHPDYFFYDGKMEPESAVQRLYYRLHPIFTAAKAEMRTPPYLFG